MVEVKIMFGPREKETTQEQILRLGARAASAVCIAIIFLYFLGKDFAFSQVTAAEWVGFVLFPVGVLIGLVLAWEEELIGGVIILVSVAGFYLVYGVLAGGIMNQGWALLPFSIPGVLFLIYGLVRRRKRTMPT